MKTLLLLLLLLAASTAPAQYLDYISVRKGNGRVLKNLYTGSPALLQTTEGNYFEGPVKAIQHDSMYLTLYDIRLLQTLYGGFIRDTISVSVIGIHYKDIQRVFLHRRQSFWGQTAAPLLKVGGAGYLALNLLNGAIYSQPLTDKRNTRRIGFAAGAFGLGLLLKKLFTSDGFSKKSNKIVYVNLSQKGKL